MKNVLNYQTSEYDCGPASFLNGVRYLFDREEIFPDIIKFIMLYTMDTYNTKGELCRRGTSAAAMHYLTNWMNHFAETRFFPHHAGEIFLGGHDGAVGGSGGDPDALLRAGHGAPAAPHEHAGQYLSGCLHLYRAGELGNERHSLL